MTIVDYGRYETRHPWPEGCMVQGQSDGLVFRRGSDEPYRTAFFEAFPREPSTFILGEGATLAEAEDSAWAQYQRVLACPGPGGHEFETRGYRNGAGFCVHCGMFAAGVFDIREVGHPCNVCGVGTNYTVLNEQDLSQRWFCERHQPTLAEYEAALGNAEPGFERFKALLALEAARAYEKDRETDC